MSTKPVCVLWLTWSSMVALPSDVDGFQAVEQLRTPAPVEALVYVRPFALARGYRWSAVDDEPETSAGFIVVVSVDTQYVVPRSGPSPILFVGDRMLQALNSGSGSGHVIGLVPGVADLSDVPFWFGSFAPPDQVSPQFVRNERARAEEAGIRPFRPEQIREATREPIRAADLEELLRGELAELVLTYAPDEEYLARKWRLPGAGN